MRLQALSTADAEHQGCLQLELCNTGVHACGSSSAGPSSDRAAKLLCLE